MTTSAPVNRGARSSWATSQDSQRTFGAVHDGIRRARPRISSTPGSAPRARTTLVPTLPVAPVTTTRKPMRSAYPDPSRDNARMPKADLVLEGGGVKGLGLVGAVLELLGAGYTFARVAGTSAGAVVASLIAAGAGGDDLEAIMQRLDYARVP